VLNYQSLRRGLFDFGEIWQSLITTSDVLLKTFKVKVKVKCQRSRPQRENVVWSPNYGSPVRNLGR